jgi:hypothetical protein
MGQLLYRYAVADFYSTYVATDTPVIITAGLYKLTHSLKAPGFNP